MNLLPELQPFLSATPYILEKICAVLFSFMYLIFAIIVMRQIKLMTDTLDVGFEVEIKVIAFAHLMFSAATFIFALII